MTVDKVSRIFKVSYATGTNVKPWCGANGQANVTDGWLMDGLLALALSLRLAANLVVAVWAQCKYIE